eukprot:1694805-Rhodomonas_salina.2
MVCVGGGGGKGGVRGKGDIGVEGNEVHGLLPVGVCDVGFAHGKDRSPDGLVHMSVEREHEALELESLRDIAEDRIEDVALVLRVPNGLENLLLLHAERARRDGHEALDQLAEVDRLVGRFQDEIDRVLHAVSDKPRVTLADESVAVCSLDNVVQIALKDDKQEDSRSRLCNSRDCVIHCLIIVHKVSDVGNHVHTELRAGALKILRKPSPIGIVHGDDRNGSPVQVYHCAHHRESCERIAGTCAREGRI